MCLDIVFLAEKWKLIVENNKKIIYGLLFTTEKCIHVDVIQTELKYEYWELLGCVSLKEKQKQNL